MTDTIPSDSDDPNDQIRIAIEAKRQIVLNWTRTIRNLRDLHSIAPEHHAYVTDWENDYQTGINQTLSELESLDRQLRQNRNPAPTPPPAS